MGGKAEGSKTEEAVVQIQHQRTAKHIELTGIVQGVGFRPFVYNLAVEHGLKGWVRNTSACVEIEVEGSSQALEAFIHELVSKSNLQ